MIKDTLKRPLRDLRISVTDRCNFRCTYCMPADVFGHEYHFIPRKEILSFEEIERLVKVFVTLGVKKIRITGGEPLIRKELEILIKKLVAIPEIQDIALTTNGYFLTEKAPLLKNAGLKRITVSLDTLDSVIFKKISGPKVQLQKVLQGIDLAKKLGFSPIKINSVIQRGVNEHEIVTLAQFGREHGYIIRFIEYMDVGTLNDWRMEKVVSAQEIVEIISKHYPVEPLEKNYPGEVANRYRYLDGKGEFGIIASVTRPFCGDCTRVRLSADGKIYTCLFASTGLDIKSRLRKGATDEELFQMLKNLWTQREDRYSELRTSHTKVPTKVEMYHIGG